MNKELAIALIDYDDHPDENFYEAVTEEEITSKDRWTVSYEQIWKDKRDGRFYEIWWRRGATEYQYEDLEESIDWREVKPAQKTVTVYVGVDA